MSELTYLEKLLDGVKVEWQTLGKVLKRTKGTKITAGQMKALHKDNAPLKIFAGGKTVAFVDFKDIPEKDINREPSIIVKSRGIIEFEYYDKPFSHKNEMWSYHSNNDAISIKYIYYFLKINEGYFQKIGGKMQMPQIATPDTDKFEVPIPCPDNPEKSLAIQSEIVRILDKFTALTAELTAELNMRKKQYNYYRDQLLSFKEGEVEWKTLGEVAKIQRGASPRPIVNYLTEQGNGIPWIKIGDTIPGSKYIDKTLQKITAEGAQKSRILNPGDFVISNSMSFGRPYILRITGAIHDGWASISNFGEKLNADYLYHYLSSKKVKNYWESKINSGSVSNLNADIIKTLPVPLPDKQKQERISALLDKFDTLTNSITEGLPREIELRQKQYEYYRDLLFSFPKPDTVSN
ncbi:restriction endonuclease subunit S [Escherichia coli]|nr:restriction endonuclease subunit S [Escherichia coli]